MVFWKLFGNKNKKIQIDQPSEIENCNEYKILIQDFDYKQKKINIFLSKDKNINLYALEELCDTVGWVRRPLRKVKIAIENSFLTISLFYQVNEDKKLIGFARATSDNTFNATIWDVVIHPDFQGKGLGKLLINETIQQLRCADINTITLFADPQVISFYKNLGFISDPDGVKGMFWYPN